MSRSDLNWKCVPTGALTSQDGSNVPIPYLPPYDSDVPIIHAGGNPATEYTAPWLSTGAEFNSVVLDGNDDPTVSNVKPNVDPAVGFLAPTGANDGINPTGITAGEFDGADKPDVNPAKPYVYGDSSFVPNSLGEFLFYNGNSHLKKTHQIINKVKSIDAEKIVATASLLYGNYGNSEAQPKLNEVAGGPAANGIQSLTKEALQYLASICTQNSFNMAFFDGLKQGRFLIDKKGNFFASYLDQGGKLVWQEFSVDGKGLAIQKYSPAFESEYQMMASGALGVMETRTNIQYEPGIYSAKDTIPFLEFQIVDDKGQVLNPSIPQNIHFTPVKFNLNALFPGLTLLTFARTDN